MEDVLAALRFCAGDKWFVIGDQVVERSRGWPMGGPVSAPCTSLDLETAIERFYANPAVAQDVGWHLDGYKAQQLVQGMLHVDDSVVFSKVYCEDCFFNGVQKLWPRDVGVSLEASGEHVPFLHVELHVHHEKGPAPVHVTPLAHNTCFARGQAAHPHYAKLAPYVGSKATTRAQLAGYVWSRLATADQALRGSTANSTEVLAELCSEAVLLQWPLPLLAAVLRSYPRTNSTDFAVLVRRTGTRLKRASPPCTTGPRVFEWLAAVVGECVASLWADAGVVP